MSEPDSEGSRLSQSALAEPEGHRMNPVKNMALNMVSAISDNVTVLRCSGRLVFSEDDNALREKVKKLLVEGHRIVVNLTELEHIDSMGLATIAGLHRLDNSRIKLVCSSVHLTGLLRRTRLDAVIRFYETEDEAAAVVSGHGALLSPSPAA
jgi:anti-anti-sigma factor